MRRAVFGFVFVSIALLLAARLASAGYQPTPYPTSIGGTGRASPCASGQFLGSDGGVWACATAAAGAGYESGLDDADTKLLLHLNGTDGGTSFPDKGVNELTITPTGAVTNQAQLKFGSASAYFDGSGDKLSVPDSTTWDFTTTPFTIEAWIRTTATNEYTAIAVRNTEASFGAGAWIFAFNTSGANGRLVVYAADYNTGSPLLSASSGDVHDGEWHHVAWVRNGNDFAIYLDGASVATATWAGSISALRKTITIGNDLVYPSRDYGGWIDEVRISSVARYTTNFTPSAAEFPAGLDRDLLPACTAAGQIVFSNGYIYVCTEAVGPTWKRITAPLEVF